jgi:diaminohydroxyphosphoribosylaminopyrimidine deaminase / 5-amino-6-(5-phosphoribosylamino)uracil reductase
LNDDPHLTIREGTILPITPALRVILDARGRLAPPMNIFSTENAPTLIVTGSNCPLEKRLKWEKSGAEVAVLPFDSEGVGIDVESVLRLLGKRNILQVLVEGGAAVHGSFLKAGCCNRLVVYVGGCVLGENGLTAFKGLAIDTLANAPRFELCGVKKLGSSARLDYALG